MSELLENLASCLSAAAEASRRLRAYVEEIDRFLGPSQSPEPQGRDHVPDYDRAITDQQPSIGETMVPLELLQRIPWDWADPMQLF